MKMQRTENGTAKTNLKKNKVGKLTLIDLKTYYKSYNIKCDVILVERLTSRSASGSVQE